MAKPKYWGTIRKVLTSLSNQFISINEDLEAVSFERARTGYLRGDFYPRGYTLPEMEVNIECLAAMREGKVKLLGFGGSESEEESVRITIRAPFSTTRLTTAQLEQIIATTEADAMTKLDVRGIVKSSDGVFIVPDEE